MSWLEKETIRRMREQGRQTMGKPPRPAPRPSGHREVHVYHHHDDEDYKGGGDSGGGRGGGRGCLLVSLGVIVAASVPLIVKLG